MPPFQFDESSQHQLSTGRSATPLRNEFWEPGHVAGAAAIEVPAVEPSVRVYAALEAGGELLTYLAQSGLHIVSLASPREAVARGDELKGHLLLLDWDYPGFDPFEVCRAMGLDRRPFPVIVLSGQSDAFDEVLAFELGVSDFIVKPVQPRILLARIKSCMKSTAGRTRAEMRTHSLVFGRLTIDLASRVVQLGPITVELSSAEFDLLAYLAARAGQIVNREEIQRALCKDAPRKQTRSIDSRMYRLRKRFAPFCDAQARIKSIRPQGYLFCDEAW